jgi:hypothetical protein
MLRKEFMAILKKWSTVTEQNPYRAPEVVPSIKLRGEVYDHPKIEDGTLVETSLVKNSIGRLVETYSGTVYSLEGEPDPNWVKYLDSIGYDLDLESPVNNVSYENSHHFRFFVKGGDA